MPIDGSEHSRKTLSSAIELAKKFSAKITLINVIQPLNTIFLGSMEEAFITRSVDELVKYANAELEDAKNEVRKAGIEVNSIIVNGSPGDEIIKYAKDNSYDLIVIGNKGHSALEEIILGSVCRYVVNHAENNVLVIK